MSGRRRSLIGRPSTGRRHGTLTPPAVATGGDSDYPDVDDPTEETDLPPVAQRDPPAEMRPGPSAEPTPPPAPTPTARPPRPVRRRPTATAPPSRVAIFTRALAIFSGTFSTTTVLVLGTWILANAVGSTRRAAPVQSAARGVARPAPAPPAVARLTGTYLGEAGGRKLRLELMFLEDQLLAGRITRPVGARDVATDAEGAWEVDGDLVRISLVEQGIDAPAAFTGTVDDDQVRGRVALSGQGLVPFSVSR